MTRRFQRPGRVIAMVAGLAMALGAGGLAVAASPTAGQSQHGHHNDDAMDPLPTSAADWQPVADALGRTGVMQAGVVYRVPLPRKDLTVTSYGVTIKPGLSLGGYAAFAKYDDGTMLMGDLVVTEDELPKVTDALQAAGLDQTAIHKHLLSMNPPIWWTHISGMGDPVHLAEGVKAALAATSIPPAASTPSPQPLIDLDTAGIDAALGRSGTADGGIYKFSIAREDQIVEGGHVLPPQLGLTTAINFQPLGGGKAAINGDFVMTAPEVQDVIKALRAGGVYVVELHNHMLDEHPRLFFLHFWATGDGVDLAKALRPALDATDLTAPTAK